jgi:hypothetical protein
VVQRSEQQQQICTFILVGKRPAVADDGARERVLRRTRANGLLNVMGNRVENVHAVALFC